MENMCMPSQLDIKYTYVHREEEVDINIIPLPGNMIDVEHIIEICESHDTKLIPIIPRHIKGK